MANPNIAGPSTIRKQSSIRKYVSPSPISLLENAVNSNEVLKINSISITNTDTFEHDITIQLVRNSVAYRILSTVRVPAKSTLVAINEEIGFYLLEGDTLESIASTADRLNVVCSYQQLAESEVADRLDLEDVDNFASGVVLLITANGANGAQNNTFLDGSANNWPITRTGSLTQGSFSPYGTRWSNSFDGDGDYLSIANNAALNMGTSSFTIEAWIYLTATPGDPGILGGIILDKDGLSGSSFPQYALSVSSTRRAVFQASAVPRTGSTPQSSITSSSVLNLHTWYHVAATRSGTTATLWVNGVSEGTTSTVPSDLTTGSRPLLIGWTDRGAPAPAFNFPGYISNLRIVRGTVVYTSAFTPSATPLTAITNTSLLTCQSNRFIDTSSNNFAITVVGTPFVQGFSPFRPAEIYSPSLTGGSGYFNANYLLPTSSQIVDFGTGNFTVEMWVYASSGTYNFFDGRSTSGQNAITLTINSDNTVSFLNSNGTVRINAAGFVFGAWNHIAVTRSGTSVRLFCNGVQIGSTFTDSSTYISGTNRPAIGAGGFTLGSTRLTGYVSNLRVVKGTAVYTANFTPPTSPVTAIAGTSLLLNFTNAGIVDQSGENNIQTLGNAQLSTTVKRYGTASLEFDGTGDFLSMPDSPDLNFGTGDFTIEMWINFNSGAGATFPRVITKGTYQASATVWGLLITRSTGLIAFNTGNPDVATNIGNLVNGVWTHIAVTRSGTALRTFFNGVLNQTATNTVNYVSTFELRVGSDPTGGDNFAGYIDDLRITKGVARYTTNFTPPDELML
jgi:hypothetical protein